MVLLGMHFPMPATGRDSSCDKVLVFSIVGVVDLSTHSTPSFDVRVTFPMGICDVIPTQSLFWQVEIRRKGIVRCREKYNLFH